MSAPLQNDLLLRALLRQPTPRTPLWMMRQAGRYLPEYRATRAKAGSFLNLCMNPELACEVTLQPLDRYRLDAAILFSDILTVPHAMNVGLSFETGEGPKIARPVRTAADIDRLPIPDPEGELRYVMDAVRTIRRELRGRVPLIGFAGSPWTVATYMVEGGGSRYFEHIKGMLYGAPRELHRLLEVITRATTLYLNAQVAAGAQAVMVFDTWGGSLTPADYREFSRRYMKQIVDGVTREAEGRKRRGIIRFPCDFRHLLGVEYVTMGIGDHHGSGKQASQRTIDHHDAEGVAEGFRAERRQRNHLVKPFGAAEPRMGEGQIL